MKREVLQKFLDLACQLSPENISCDGELTNAAINKKYRALMKQWHKLEQQEGRQVTQSEVWKESWKKLDRTQ